MDGCNKVEVNDIELRNSRSCKDIVRIIQKCIYLLDGVRKESSEFDSKIFKRREEPPGDPWMAVLRMVESSIVRWQEPHRKTSNRRMETA